MDFDLSEEQSLLKESVDRLIADRYAFEDRKRYLSEADGWSRSMWGQYAELGLLGLPFEELYGGSARGAVETMIVMEALGRGIALEPYLATVVLAGSVLRHGGSAAQKAMHLPRISEGSHLMALAYAERFSRYDLAQIACTAKKDGSGWVLDGEKTGVTHGDGANTLIVAARTGGKSGDRGGIGLFLVDGNAPGVTRRSYATQDNLRAADVTLKGVRVGADAVVGDPGGGLPLLEQAIDDGIAATCAEAVGAMEAMHAVTVEYLKTRQQFGVPIGSFQALQHRAVDMLVHLEQARSMTFFATMMATNPDPVERRRALSAAKVQIGRSARWLGQQAIQLHGGIGVTMEYKVGHYFLRTTTIEFQFGDADHHLAQFARSGGFIPARA